MTTENAADPSPSAPVRTDEHRSVPLHWHAQFPTLAPRLAALVGALCELSPDRAVLWWLTDEAAARGSAAVDALFAGPAVRVRPVSLRSTDAASQHLIVYDATTAEARVFAADHRALSVAITENFVCAEARGTMQVSSAYAHARLVQNRSFVLPPLQEQTGCTLVVPSGAPGAWTIEGPSEAALVAFVRVVAAYAPGAELTDVTAAPMLIEDARTGSVVKRVDEVTTAPAATQPTPIAAAPKAAAPKVAAPKVAAPGPTARDGRPRWWLPAAVAASVGIVSAAAALSGAPEVPGRRAASAPATAQTSSAPTSTLSQPPATAAPATPGQGRDATAVVPSTSAPSTTPGSGPGQPRPRRLSGPMLPRVPSSPAAAKRKSGPKKSAGTPRASASRP